MSYCSWDFAIDYDNLQLSHPMMSTPLWRPRRRRIFNSNAFPAVVHKGRYVLGVQQRERKCDIGSHSSCQRNRDAAV